MTLDKIVYTGKGDSVVVLNSDGTSHSTFNLKKFPWDIFIRKNSLIMNLGSEIRCTDLSGEIIWSRDEFTSEDANIITPCKDGMFVSHLKSKKSSKDINLAKLTYDGRLLWDKKIREDAWTHEDLLLDENKLIMNYASYNDGQGILIFDLNGNVVNSLEGDFFPPNALFNSLYLYQEYKEKNTPSVLRVIDIDTQQKIFEQTISTIPPYSRGNQISCSLYNDRVFLDNRSTIYSYDFLSKSLKELRQNNYKTFISPDRIYIKETDNKTQRINKEDVTGTILIYSHNLERLDQVKLNQLIVKQGYSVHLTTGGILVSSPNILVKINEDGKQEWVNNLENYVNQTAKIIEY